jgi:hypothetical protein
MNYQKYYNSQISQEGGKIDYKTYYLNQQTGSGLPVFSGYSKRGWSICYQRGDGQYVQGGIFRDLYNWII